MFKKISTSTISLAAFICLLISDIITVFVSFNVFNSGALTILVVILNLITVGGLLVLGFKFRWKNELPYGGLVVFKLFMLWSFFEFIRGLFNANDYWDWRTLLLSYSFSVLTPMAIICGINYQASVKLFNFILKKLFIFGFLAIPFAVMTDHQLFARVVAAVTLFLLFVPYLKFNWRFIVFVVALISLVVDISYRSNTIRIVMAFFLLLVFLNRNIVRVRVLNIFAIILICLPLAFLYLGVANKFNVFSENIFDYEVSSSNSSTRNLSTDTRTFIYQEVFESMISRKSSFIFGEGGGAAYQSDAFGNLLLNEQGRYGSEVGFLNAVLYSGAIGVLLYALMLFIAAYYAINRSSNYLSKLLGIFLVFHWVIFFFEDRVRLDMNTYFIWLAIGLCLSNKFRGMSDIEVKKFLNWNLRRSRKASVDYANSRSFI